MSSRPFLVAQGLSALRIPLSVGACWCTTEHWWWPALALMLVSEFSDMADGQVARRFGVQSAFGAVFDPYCDSISRLIVYYGLAAAGFVPAWLVLLMGRRDVSIAYVRLGQERAGFDCSARISGKLKAIVQGGTAVLFVGFSALGVEIPWFQTLALWSVATVTVWSLVDYTMGLVNGVRAKK